MNKTIKLADNKTIDSLKFLVQNTSDPTAIIKNICRGYRLTDDFIKEFRSYIDAEAFTTSYKLTSEMADNYPDLFDEDLLVKFTNREDESQEEDEEDSLMDEMFKAVQEDRISRLSISMIERLGDKISYDEDQLTDILRLSTEEEILNHGVNFLGKDNEIDKLILMKVKDETMRNNVLLAIQATDDKQLSSESYKYFGNDIKENMIGDEEVNSSEFIKMLVSSNDIAWQIKMLDKATSGELKFIKGKENVAVELVKLVQMLPEDQIVKVVKLYDYMPASLNFKVFTIILEECDCTEDHLIEMIDYFKKSGSFFILKNYAKQNNYIRLLMLLEKK